MYLTLYKDGHSHRVPMIDVPGWKKQGWGEDENTKSKPVDPEIVSTGLQSVDERRTELEEVGWAEIKALMAEYGLSTDKPSDETWADWGIPQILKHEGY